jgi:hypothetical protein
MCRRQGSGENDIIDHDRARALEPKFNASLIASRAEMLIGPLVISRPELSDGNRHRFFAPSIDFGPFRGSCSRGTAAASA